jgi:hypothetical protein
VWISDNALTACAALGFAGFTMLGMLSFTWEEQWSPLRVYYSVGWLAVLALCAASVWRHRTRGTHPYAEQEWRVTLACHLLAPFVGLAFAGVLHLATGLDAETAEMAGVAVGWGACGLAAFVIVDRQLRLAAVRHTARVRHTDSGYAESAPHRTLGITGHQHHRTLGITGHQHHRPGEAGSAPDERLAGVLQQGSDVGQEARAEVTVDQPVVEGH